MNEDKKSNDDLFEDEFNQKIDNILGDNNIVFSENVEAVSADETMDEETAHDEQDEEQKTSVAAELYDWAQALAFPIVCVVLIFTFVVRIIGVVGDSMIPTFHEDDRIVVSNFNYSPSQGDVVVMRSFLEEPIVKRIIATEGQTVDIDFDAHEVFVNGRKIDEPYINAPTSARRDVQFPVTVPEGYVFVLGDNRQFSTDSRDSRVGMVDARNIIGRVLFKIYPFSDIGVVKSYDYS